VTKALASAAINLDQAPANAAAAHAPNVIYTQNKIGLQHSIARK
jgi:hypothetical protein